MAIKTPADLKVAILIAITATNETKPSYFDIIWDIHKYKWYNYYQHNFIAKDSSEDRENGEIFKQLEAEYPDIHIAIEKNIEFEIEKTQYAINLTKK
jgi:hypothetical protein